MNVAVTIDSDALEELLQHARRGDVANSQRRLRHGFRHVAICSGDHRGTDYFTCQAFAAAEAAMSDTAHA